MRRVILFTGLVRDAGRFVRLLDEAASDVAESGARLIFSTWAGELDRYPGLLPELLARGFAIVEQEQPGPRFKGHLFHQLLSLEAGLELCDATDIVLKTRADMAIVDEFAAFARYVPAAVGPRAAAGFVGRFAVRGFFPSQPLFINDIVFAGYAADLRRLPRLGLSALATYGPRASTEQMIWSGAFAPACPEIDAFLRVTPGLVFLEEPLRSEVHRLLAVDPLYARAVARGLDVVEHHLEWLLPQPQQEAATNAHTLDELFWAETSLPGVRLLPHCGANFFGIAPPADAMIAGRFAPSELGDNVRHQRAAGTIAAELASEARALGTALATVVPLDGTLNHLTEVHPGRFRRGGRFPDWLAQNGETTTIHELETNLVGMRRAHDMLVRQVAELQARQS